VKPKLDTLLLHEIDAAYTFARWSIGSPDRAAAAIQDATIRVLQYPQDCYDGHPRAGVLRLVRSVVLNQIQSPGNPGRSLHELQPDAFGDLITPNSFSIGARAAGVDLEPGEIEALRRGIADLGLEQREAVVLRDTQGLSYREIAAVLTIPLRTMVMRLSEARDALQGPLRYSCSRAASHDRAPALIDAYIDAEIDIATAAAFVQHIAACRDCAIHLLNRSRLVQQIRTATQCCAPSELCRWMKLHLGAKRATGTRRLDMTVPENKTVTTPH